MNELLNELINALRIEGNDTCTLPDGNFADTTGRVFSAELVAKAIDAGLIYVTFRNAWGNNIEWLGLTSEGKQIAPYPVSKK